MVVSEEHSSRCRYKCTHAHMCKYRHTQVLFKSLGADGTAARGNVRQELQATSRTSASTPFRMASICTGSGSNSQSVYELSGTRMRLSGESALRRIGHWILNPRDSKPASDSDAERTSVW